MFDIIIGNPPYNKGGIKSSSGKHLGEKNETIWPLFVNKAFEMLKEDGYLLYIHPLSFLRKSHSVYNIILEKHLIYLELWDNIQSKQLINAEIPLAIYLLKNTTKKEETEICTILKELRVEKTSRAFLKIGESIPFAYHNIFNKLADFIKKNNLQLEYNSRLIKIDGEKFKLPKEYTINDLLYIDTYKIKEGIIVKKGLFQHPDADKRKLIIANKCKFKGIFIDENKLGLTGSNKYYILGDNLELIQKILSFKVFNIVCDYTKYNQNFLNPAAFGFIPDLRKLNIKDITEDEFYDLIGFTEEEKSFLLK